MPYVEPYLDLITVVRLIVRFPIETDATEARRRFEEIVAQVAAACPDVVEAKVMTPQRVRRPPVATEGIHDD